jgi:methylated-DNA-protein-cysteine methyltransferase-like protein
MDDFYERIYALVREIPRGRVTTYGQLGVMCGIGDARIVGEAMNASTGLPWQRVINARGEISMRGATGERQRRLLEEEGVTFDENGHLDLAVYGWTPDPDWLRARGYRVPPPLVKDGKKPDGKQPSLF